MASQGARDLETASFYWTVVAGIVGALWIAVQFLRDRIAQSVTHTNALIERLMTIDKLLIDNPESQQYLSATAVQGEDYFREAGRLNESCFYKAKTLAYMHLNTFDELLSLSSQKRGPFSLMNPPALIELSDWENYILVKIRHPIYRSILNNEKEIFGASLRDFWAQHKKKIETATSDPFIW